jgi:ribosome biogenesis GTPase
VSVRQLRFAGNKGRSPLDTLESLGWNTAWKVKFEPFADAGLCPGRVFAAHREIYAVQSQHGEALARVSGRMRHEARQRADFPAVGDWVAIDPTGGGGQWVTHAVVPRLNHFSRRLAGNEADEQIVAANLDTLFLVTSLNRDLNPRRIERYLAAASAQQVGACILLSKCDLCECPGEAVDQLGRLFPYIAIHALSAQTGEGMAALDRYLSQGRTVALVGSSGVGKSTLVNRLLGRELQSVAAIREDDDRGRHATTHREMFHLPLPRGGLLIDNPGMRELQLWNDGVDLDTTFTDIADLATRCRYRDCRHEHEPRCAVREALETGTLDGRRFENYCKLQRELAYLESQQDPAAERERKESARRVHRIHNKAYRRRERR